MTRSDPAPVQIDQFNVAGATFIPCALRNAVSRPDGRRKITKRDVDLAPFHDRMGLDRIQELPLCRRSCEPPLVHGLLVKLSHRSFMYVSAEFASQTAKDVFVGIGNHYDETKSSRLLGRIRLPPSPRCIKYRDATLAVEKTGYIRH